MKNNLKRTLCVCIIALFCGPMAAPLSAEDDLVQAKIGIKIKTGQGEMRARARNQLRAGDYIRVCVHPQKDAWVYVVHADESKAALLNMTMQRVHSTLLCLPSMYAFYRLDGGSPLEKITIVCSPKELPKLSEMIDGDLPADRWAAFEDDLMAQSEISLAREGERTFGIAGNVRGTETLEAGDPFVQNLPIYSGKGLLIKTYAFMVQK